MLNGFWLDGVCSLDVGIRLQSGITFGQPTPRVTATTISGRSGDLTEWDGSYSNISATAKCFALTGADVSDTLPTIAAFLRGTTFSYRRLETEEEPNVYRMARVVNFPETDIRANHLAPFTISLDCKPQKYLKDGENAVEVKSGDFLYNPTVFPSLPLIALTVTGDAKLQVGGTQISVTGYTGPMYLDCEMMDAYKEAINLNKYVTAPEFPTLGAGATQISWSGGISKCEITPRWWTL